MKVVIDDRSIPAKTRKWICDVFLNGILTFSEIKTVGGRRKWAKKHPEWVDLDMHMKARLTELEWLHVQRERERAKEKEQEALELAEMLEPEMDSFEYDFQ